MAICDSCGKEMATGDGCVMVRITYDDGTIFDVLKYGEDGMAGKFDNSPCPDCACRPGEYHHNMCDIERCPKCGGQFISCGCSPRLFEEMDVD